jgi:hypothetical protein
MSRSKFQRMFMQSGLYSAYTVLRLALVVFKVECMSEVLNPVNRSHLY